MISWKSPESILFSRLSLLLLHSSSLLTSSCPCSILFYSERTQELLLLSFLSSVAVLTCFAVLEIKKAIKKHSSCCSALGAAVYLQLAKVRVSYTLSASFRYRDEPASPSALLSIFLVPIFPISLPFSHGRDLSFSFSISSAVCAWSNHFFYFSSRLHCLFLSSAIPEFCSFLSSKKQWWSVGRTERRRKGEEDEEKEKNKKKKRDIFASLHSRARICFLSLLFTRFRSSPHSYMCIRIYIYVHMLRPQRSLSVYLYLYIGFFTFIVCDLGM